MNARQIIEAEDPKSVFKQMPRPPQQTFNVSSSSADYTIDEHGNVLKVKPTPYGDGPEPIARFDLEEWKRYYGTEELPDTFDILDLACWFTDGEYYEAEATWRDPGEIEEAEDPKSVLKMAGGLRPVNRSRETELFDRRGNSIVIQWVEGPGPFIGYLKFAGMTPEEMRDACGLILLNGAYDLVRKRGHSQVRVGVGTATHRTMGHDWGIFDDEPGYLGNLINQSKVGRITMRDGMVRHIALESEDPKRVLRQAAYAQNPLYTLLIPYGFERYGDSDGTVLSVHGNDTLYYAVPGDDKSFTLDIFKIENEHSAAFVFDRSVTVPYDKVPEVMAELGLPLNEAEDPKSVLRQASTNQFEQMVPYLKSIAFKPQEMGGKRMERELGNTMISISSSVHRDKAFVVIYRRTAQNRWQHEVDFTVPYVDLTDWKLMAMMQRDPEGAASMYPKTKWWAENVLTLEPGGKLKLDTRPKAPHSIWTHRRKDPEGNPQPYRRVRTLPNGRAFEMVVAYRKDQAPTQLLRVAKQYGPEVAKMAGWAASDIAHALQDEGVTLVMPIPSQKPLARRLARLVANRLGVPFEDRVEKTGSVAHVPISKRKAVAPRLYSVSGKVKGQVVCLVDDYVVTSASMMAAAVHLYKAGARKVVGAALAI